MRNSIILRYREICVLKIKLFKFRFEYNMIYLV